MNLGVLSELEAHIDQLSVAEQLALLEYVAQRLRKNLGAQSDLENKLVLMAADPDIQRELREINEEFASMEADGLDPA
ncbi:MAG: hypothetical protein HYV01_22005 [Deltaproteobacteria bacterium]|nr:hypothetical protein [Deltaproteobacteria bacterium]